MHRQRHTEQGAPFRTLLNADSTAVFFYDLSGYRQTQSRALGPFRREEGVEDPLLQRFGNARAVVHNLEEDLVVVKACADMDRAAFVGYRVARIQQQIQQAAMMEPSMAQIQQLAR